MNDNSTQALYSLSSHFLCLTNEKNSWQETHKKAHIVSVKIEILLPRIWLERLYIYIRLAFWR
jgi:hypothetical protein